MQRGEIWWADLPEPTGATPGYRRPVLLIQADAFLQSRIATVIAVIITSNLRIATAPGNVFLRATESGLAKDSVINVSQIVTLDKHLLDEQIGHVTATTLADVENGIRLVLDL
ncbi:MAG: type II toxin-antitoxin system PemK/MazF family toxin [Kouleothrix sp.]|nr:type II toxin-antitoxin system PemK/MazF family toxin [Kouleothrix sp.]